MKNYLSLLVCAFLFGSSFISAQDKYKTLNKFPIDSDGAYTGVTADEEMNRIFISNGAEVKVMNGADGKPLGPVKGMTSTNGIAFCENMNHGYVTNGKDSSFTVFDLKTLNRINSIRAMGRNPDAVLFDFYTQRLFVFNKGSNNISVFDVSVDKFITNIKLDGKPESAVNDDKGNIYVNISDLGMVCRINTSKMKVENKWRLREGKGPTGIAIDKENNRLFSVCANKLLMVSDGETGKIIAALPVGENAATVAFDPLLKRVYSANGDGTLTVVQEKDADTFKVTETIKTQKGASLMVLNAKTHHLFLPVAASVLDIAPALPDDGGQKNAPPVKEK